MLRRCYYSVQVVATLEDVCSRENERIVVARARFQYQTRERGPLTGSWG